MQKIRSTKRSWSQPLADLVGAAISPVLAKQGFGEADIILYWEDIVGERLAKRSQPIKLQWPPRGKIHGREIRQEPATLVVRVEGGFALEMQHLSGLVIERVNAHLGWNCVGRLTLRQGPLEPRHRRANFQPFVAAPGAAEAAEKIVIGISDTDLRRALANLGARVISR
jgi:hypothetical protein